MFEYKILTRGALIPKSELCALGLDGWELVTVITETSVRRIFFEASKEVTCYTYYFKRTINTKT